MPALLFILYLFSSAAFSAPTHCPKDTVHCSFAHKSIVPPRRLITQPVVTEFCVTESNNAATFRLNDGSNTPNFLLLEKLLNDQYIPTPSFLYIREGSVINADEVQYLVPETNSTDSVQWIIAQGLNIMYRAADTSSSVDSFRIPEDTAWRQAKGTGSIEKVQKGACPTASPTAQPTPTPTSTPTPVHPCHINGEHNCDAEHGLCQMGSSNTGDRTTATAQGHTYHCKCKEGYVFIDPQNTDMNACMIVTATPTVAPTTIPTVMPTNTPTTLPTIEPTGNPTATRTASPTNAPSNAPTYSPTAQLTSPISTPTNAPPTPAPTPAAKVVMQFGLANTTAQEYESFRAQFESAVKAAGDNSGVTIETITTIEVREMGQNLEWDSDVGRRQLVSEDYVRIKLEATVATLSDASVLKTFISEPYFAESYLIEALIASSIHQFERCAQAGAGVKCNIKIDPVIVIITPGPALTPTPAPTKTLVDPTPSPTMDPLVNHPCRTGNHRCDPTYGVCTQDQFHDDDYIKAKIFVQDGFSYQCDCQAGYDFKYEDANAHDSAENLAISPWEGNRCEIHQGGEIAPKVAGKSAGTNGTVVAASAGLVGAGLLVAGLAARRKREEEEEDEEEAERRKKRIVWSDSMDLTASIGNDAAAKAAAQQQALQMGMAMGAAEANRMADNGSFSSSFVGRQSAALNDVTLDDGTDVEDEGNVPAWMMSGWVVDKKEIEYLSELGQGAFGAVSLVRVRGTLMAAKQLNPDVEHEKEKREELLREVKAMAELQHTNVVRIFGVCLDPGHTCVLMEFASNGTVRDMLDQAQKEGAPLPTYALFGLMRDIVLGMRHAHAHQPNPILHRDLKAANILLDDNHRALVSDFGLATTDESPEEAGGGGTLAYSPPEVLQAMTRSDTSGNGWSAEGDVFSFGILAWELITASVPYKGANARGLFKNVVGEAKRPHGKRWDIPLEGCDPFLADVIRRCWAQKIEDRPSFKQLSEEFEKMANEARFQTPDNIYDSLDDLVNSQSARDLADTLKGLEEKDVKLDVQKLLAQEDAKAERVASASARVEGAKDNEEAKNVLTETFANFYSDVFGNNKADEEDDLEDMV